MSAPTYEDLARQLSKGLDLCVRARRLDAQERMNATRPEFEIMTRSATIPVWVQDQYDRDLFAWETETRALLTQLPLHAVSARLKQEP